MSIVRDNHTAILTIPRSSVFRDIVHGLRVVAKRYFLNIDVVHGHDFFELVLVRSGGGVHVTERGETQLERGDVYLIRPGALHCYRDLQDLEIVNVLYLPELLDLPLGELRTLAGYIAFFEASPTLADSLLPTAVKLGETEMREAERILARVLAEQEAARPGCAFGMMAGFMQLILLISRAATRNCSETTAALGEIGRLLTYLERHCTDALQISDLARGSGISVRTLERLFRQVTGRSPGDYLAELRLNRGAKLLLESALPVAQVARLAGYGDGGYFSRLFRKKFGCPPREYRRRKRPSLQACIVAGDGT